MENEGLQRDTYADLGKFRQILNHRPMTPELMKQRTKEMALRVIRLCNSLPKGDLSDVVRRQLLRCATSVGANYRAACRAKSVADFSCKISIVEEETDETAYWIELLVEAGLVKQSRVSELLKELNELTAIASASRKTSRVHSNRQSSISNRQSR